MGKAENKIETHFIKCIEKLGGYCIKQNGTGRRGKLDQLAILPHGTVWFVECKRPEGGCSSGQIREIQRLEGLGQCVAVVDTKKEVAALVYEIQLKMGVRGKFLNRKGSSEYIQVVSGVNFK